MVNTDQQAIKIICVHCKAHVYNYLGQRTGIMLSALAEPVKPEYGKPQPNQEAICPECGENIFHSVPNEQANFMRQWRKKLQHKI